MKIRALTGNDIPEIQDIYEKHYKYEFNFADLFQHPLGLFVVTDDNDKIICAGNVRNILEVVLLTDKDRTVRERRSALYNVLEVAEYIARNKGFDQLHAFVQDESWLKHLERVNFYPTKGKSLVRCF